MGIQREEQSQQPSAPVAGSAVPQALNLVLPSIPTTLTLAELCLVLHFYKETSLQKHGIELFMHDERGIKILIRSCLLLELVVQQRIKIVNTNVVVISTAPLYDELHDKILNIIANYKGRAKTLHEWVSFLYEGANCDFFYLREKFIKQCRQKQLLIPKKDSLFKSVRCVELYDPFLFDKVREVIRFLCLTPSAKIHIVAPPAAPAAMPVEQETPTGDEKAKSAINQLKHQEVNQQASAPPMPAEQEQQQQEQQYQHQYQQVPYQQQFAFLPQQYQMQQHQDSSVLMYPSPPTLNNQQAQEQQQKTPQGFPDDDAEFEIIAQEHLTDMFSFNAIDALMYARFSVLISLLKQVKSPLLARLFTKQDLVNENFKGLEAPKPTIAVDQNVDMKLATETASLTNGEVLQIVEAVGVGLQLVAGVLEILFIFAK